MRLIFPCRFLTICLPFTFFAGFAAASGTTLNSALLEDPRFDPAEILNPEYAPDSEWASRLREKDRHGAAIAMTSLLRTGPSRIDLEQSIPVIRIRWFGVPINHLGGRGFDADEIVNLRYVGTYGIEHQFEDEIDWTFDGSHGRTPEWTWQMNRHLHWINLADAYESTGDKKYAQAWERELRSWIEQCPRPDNAGNHHGSAWRSLDTGIRAGSTWPYAFEIFRKSPHVSDEAIWLLFAAQRENALHLKDHPAGGNWKIMQTNGLGHAGLMFPELKGADEFVQTAIRHAQEEIEHQFFPDGTHQEFAPHYAAAGCITNFYALAQLAERNGFPLPDGFHESLAHLVMALARIATPDGIAPGLHNSLPIDVKQLFTDVVARREPEAVPPWTEPVSDLLPHGGYAVFRRRDSYGMFNAGPRGTAHFHDDDLQLLTYFRGHHFAIDPGTPRYTNEPLSRHLRTSAAHNVVLMDGALHEPAIKIQRPHQPMPLAFVGEGRVQAGAARRTLTQVEGGPQFDHERVVLDVEGLGWVVLDRLFPPDDAVHSWEWVWNMPVDQVETSATSAIASYTNGPSMMLAVAGNVSGVVSVAKGEEGPEPRGWMNQRHATEYIPIPAIRFLTKAQSGPVWTVTVHSPSADSANAQPVRMDASARGSDEWNVQVQKSEELFRLRFRAAEDEVRQVTAWRNGQEISSFKLGSHTLRP